MAHRRARHEEEEEHENHERWLVTYADMVTLLMVLFIVMFAMSQVDERKFMELKNGLAAGFAHSSSVLPGADTLLEESGTSPMQPVAPQLVEQTAQEAQDAAKDAGKATDASDQAAQDAAESRLKAMQEVSGYRQIEEELRKALGAKGLAKDVKTTVDDRGLVISLVSKHVTFAADQATLTPRGEAVVDTLGPVLAALPEDVQVAGNTNQAPGHPELYATDWDLSAARAVTVLRRLNEVLGVPADRLSVAAFGSTRPLEDPAQPGSQEVNKRVDLVLVSPSDEATRKLAQQYAAEGPGSATAATALATTPTSNTTNTPTTEEQHR